MNPFLESGWFWGKEYFLKFSGPKSLKKVQITVDIK
jgi:hypothetical protein